MPSVETHTQFTGSHSKPEAQGRSGWEHLCNFILDTGTKIFVLQHKRTHTLHYNTFSHMWSVVALLMMECSGRLERHSHEVWLMKVTMTTDRSILGGDSSISWQTYRLALQGWVCVCAQENGLLFIYWHFCPVYLCKCETFGKSWFCSLNNRKQWCIPCVQLQPKGVPLQQGVLGYKGACCLTIFLSIQLHDLLSCW